jgi:predicted ATPase
MFLAMVAQAGVHVVVETHSDHVINGIQLAIVKQTIQHELVTVNFFEQIKKSEQPQITTIAFSEKGELECWPSGFFDQSQRDLAELFNARRLL